MRPARCLLIGLLLCLLTGVARAEEPFFKKGDVIAIVGGEDMVALSEYGYLELLLTRALPDYHLRFRNLAWEGDTVFEQRRDLGFPPWEEQLEKIGATVVLCQFGQMESLAGKEKLPQFIAAYEKLLRRFGGGGKRRVVLLMPTRFDFEMDGFSPKSEDDKIKSARLSEYVLAIISLRTEGIDFGLIETGAGMTRDGIHLSIEGQVGFALQIEPLARPKDARVEGMGYSKKDGTVYNRGLEPLRQLIIAKNRLWFDYWRVQNWAFLAGDRTNQPSSRDHLDPAKRWFPEERERFLPLIEAKEREIDALAQKLAQP